MPLRLILLVHQVPGEGMMNKTILFILAIGLANSAFADSIQNSFCIRVQNNGQVQTISQLENRIAFNNAGGIFKSGVCWWHSRLQRAATYLTVFHPERKKPTTSKEANRILNRIKSLKEVVEIPGYQNFHEFTEAWKRTTQKFLNTWQIEDALLHQAWIRGLQGSPRENAEKLQAVMIRLQEEIRRNKITFLKLQLKGIAAHAWLVYSIEEIPQGMRLWIIDSNDRDAVFYDYSWGDRSFKTDYYGSFMPYLEQTEDFKWINNSVSRYCSY